MTQRDIFVVGAARTAIGTFGGSLKDVPNTQLATTAVKAAIERSGVAPAEVGHVVMGNVIPTDTRDAYLSRVAAVDAGCPIETPAFNVNRLCGSGLQAIVSAAQAIALGDCDIAIGAGSESMSRGPYFDTAARHGARMGDAQLIDYMIGILHDPWEKMHMGITAENVAARYGISREQQDRYGVRSQERADDVERLRRLVIVLIMVALFATLAAVSLWFRWQDEKGKAKAMAEDLKLIQEDTRSRNLASFIEQTAKSNFIEQMDKLAFKAYQSGDWEVALMGYDAAREMCQQIQDSYREAKIVRDIGRTFVKMKDYKQAIYYFSYALHLFEEKSPSGSEVGDVLISLVKACDYAGNKQICFRYLHKALEHFTNVKDWGNALTIAREALTFGDMNYTIEYFRNQLQRFCEMKDWGGVKGVEDLLIKLGKKNAIPTCERK